MNTPAAPPLSPAVRRRRRVLLGIAAFVLLAAAALAADISRQRAHTEHIAWAGPAELNHTTDRPTLVRFTADWCPPCQVMKREVFAIPQIAAKLEAHYRPVSVDLSHPFPGSQDLLARYGVQYFPSFIILSPQGTEIARAVGGLNAQQFTALLDRHAGP